MALYQDVNPVPTSPLAHDLATAPSGSVEELLFETCHSWSLMLPKKYLVLRNICYIRVSIVIEMIRRP